MEVVNEVVCEDLGEIKVAVSELRAGQTSIFDRLYLLWRLILRSPASTCFFRVLVFQIRIVVFLILPVRLEKEIKKKYLDAVDRGTLFVLAV
jgi:hypothetical protein